MKATLEFNLPEDHKEHILAVNAMGFAIACWDIDQRLRDWLKYGHKFESADEALEKTREAVRDILDEHNINLDMIE